MPRININHEVSSVEEVIALEQFIGKLYKLKSMDERTWDGLDEWPTPKEIMEVLEGALGDFEVDYYSKRENAGCYLLRYPSKAAYILLEVWPEDHIGIRMTSKDCGVDAEEVFEAIEAFLMDKVHDEDDKKVAVWFSYMAQHGPRAVRRLMEAPTWEDVATNYQNGDELIKLFNMKDAHERGKLIFWHGDPGTGKSYAIRVLMQAWKKKADFIYIMDPEVYFSEPAYMMTSMIRDTEEDPFPSYHRRRRNRINLKAQGENEEVDETDRIRVFVIEDGLKILETESREDLAEPMARLLNLTEGMIGQGFRILLLVTTNEDIKAIDPAMLRHGRCLQKLEFKSFQPGQAALWAQKHECKITESMVNEEMTLAQLYAVKNGCADETMDDGTIGFTR